MQASHPEKVDLKSLRRGLRDWHSLKSLSENPLVSLEVVQARHAAAAYSDSHTGWGLALRDTLGEAIESLKPQAGRRLYEYRDEVLSRPGRPATPGESMLIGSVYTPARLADSEREPKDRAWRFYFILCEQFLHQRNPEWVAEQLHISKGTYYSEQKNALDRLAGVIDKWEEQLGHLIPPVQPSPIPARQSQIPFLAPPRPAYRLVGRSGLLGDLRDRLLVDREPPMLTLQGLPGSGKTALAIALAHDRQVMEQYPDGILWVSLGRQPDILAWQIQWALALGLSESAITRRSTQAERAQILHAAIGMQRMLLVIDDAWRSEDALAFQLGGPHCVTLLTTRLVSVALDFSTYGIIEVPELDLNAGLALLAQFVPHLQAAEPAAAAGIVRAAGGLPLELALVGSHLRRNQAGSQPRRLKEALSALESPALRFRLALPEPALTAANSQPGETSRSLQSAIGASYSGLSLPAQQAWRALALFEPKPNTFSEAAALTISGSPCAALDELVDQGILECQPDGRYTMHRTIAEYGALQKTESGAVRRMLEYYLAFAAGHAGDPGSLDRERTNLEKTLSLAEKSRFQLAGEPGMEALQAYLAEPGLAI